MISTNPITGTHGDYYWLSSEDLDLNTLLRLCPDIVLGRHLAVTSIDSGPLRLNDAEKAAGWTAGSARLYSELFNGEREYREDRIVAYSPLINSVHGLPNEGHDQCCSGFDEWYLFPDPPPTCDIEVFVNWGGFRLNDPAYDWAQERFWRQIAVLAPESFIAENYFFTFVTRDAALFANVLRQLSAEPNQETNRAP